VISRPNAAVDVTVSETLHSLRPNIRFSSTERMRPSQRDDPNSPGLAREPGESRPPSTRLDDPPGGLSHPVVGQGAEARHTVQQRQLRMNVQTPADLSGPIHGNMDLDA